MDSDRAASPAELSAGLGPITTAPEGAGVFFDLDGTLAPIVDRPEQAGVPARSRELLERIADRYALVGVVSGRQATEARRIVGLDGLTYVGNHGFELLPPRAPEPIPAPALVGSEAAAAEYAAALDPSDLEEAGLRTENKGAIIALHWRGAEDEAGAAAEARAIASRAEADGLFTHWGRKVLELRPPVRINKGIGLASVLAESDVRTAFYAGDDRTDVDAFRALAELVASGQLEAAVSVAVDSDETPAEVAEGANLAVAGPEGFVTVLEALA